MMKKFMKILNRLMIFSCRHRLVQFVIMILSIKKKLMTKKRKKLFDEEDGEEITEIICAHEDEEFVTQKEVS